MAFAVAAVVSPFDPEVDVANLCSAHTMLNRTIVVIGSSVNISSMLDEDDESLDASDCRIWLRFDY